MPLTRPADTLSPSDGERDGVRAICSRMNALWYELRKAKQLLVSISHTENYAAVTAVLEG